MRTPDLRLCVIFLEGEENDEFLVTVFADIFVCRHDDLLSYPGVALEYIQILSQKPLNIHPDAEGLCAGSAETRVASDGAGPNFGSAAFFQL